MVKFQRPCNSLRTSRQQIRKTKYLARPHFAPVTNSLYIGFAVNMCLSGDYDYFIYGFRACLHTLQFFQPAPETLQYAKESPKIPNRHITETKKYTHSPVSMERQVRFLTSSTIRRLYSAMSCGLTNSPPTANTTASS